MDNIPEDLVSSLEEECRRLQRLRDAEERCLAQREALLAALQAEIAPKDHCLAERQAYVHQIGIALDKLDAAAHQLNCEFCERRGDIPDDSILKRSMRDFVRDKLDAMIDDSFPQSVPSKHDGGGD